MAEFGYDLAGESVALFLKHEVETNNKIDLKNKKVDQLVTKMEELEVFLNLVANRTNDSNRLDLTNAEDQAFVDKLREEKDLQHIFPHGKYSWKENEIENLNRMIHQHIEGPIQRNISMLSEQMVLDQHDLSKAMEMFKSGLNRMNNLIDRISSNIQRAH